MHLHSEQGIVATSWEDIAHEADVAVATVYRYFPSIDELVRGCGALVMETVRPPKPQDASALLRDTRSVSERLRRVVAEFCALFERAEKPFTAMMRDCDKVPPLQEAVRHLQETVDAYVRVALGDDTDPEMLRLVAGMLDFPVWKALIDRGVGREQVRDALGHVVEALAQRPSEQQVHAAGAPFVPR